MVKVTREEFYRYIGSRDIVVVSERAKTRFERRDRVLVGEIDGGYASPSDQNGYYLTDSAYRELKNELAG